MTRRTAITCLSIFCMPTLHHQLAQHLQPCPQDSLDTVPHLSIKYTPPSFLLQALSDAHAFLFEERQRLLALQAENDELRLQEIEDRKRIQQLIDYDPLLAQRSGAATDKRSLDTLMLQIESLQAQLSEQVRGRCDKG